MPTGEAETGLTEVSGSGRPGHESVPGSGTRALPSMQCCLPAVGPPGTEPTPTPHYLSHLGPQ